MKLIRILYDRVYRCSVKLNVSLGFNTDIAPCISHLKNARHDRMGICMFMGESCSTESFFFHQRRFSLNFAHSGGCSRVKHIMLLE